MEKNKVMVYCFKTKCIDCNKEIVIYYTVPDFGDAPVIKRCKNCGEYYWYTPENEAYNKAIEKQLDGLHCEKCNAELKNSLVLTHMNITCCGSEFSLDEDFAGNLIPDGNKMVPLEVYFIYS